MFFKLFIETPSLIYSSQWVFLNALIFTLFGTFIGACIGSFSTVISSRYKSGRTIFKPARSFCPKCAKQLSPIQNTPILGWLIQKGKCKNCKIPIPISYLVIELIYTNIWLISLLLLPKIYQGFIIAIILTILSTIIQTKFRNKIWKNYSNSKVPTT